MNIFDEEFQILHANTITETDFSEVDMPDAIDSLIQEIIALSKLSKEIV